MSSMASVISIVSRYLDSEWRQSGPSNIAISCPNPSHAHRESTKNCYIHVEKQVFFCHGCGIKGPLKKLLMFKHVELDVLTQVDTTFQRPDIPRATQYLDDVVLAAYRNLPQAWIDLGFEADLLAQEEIGYDRLNNRITIPLRDREGRLLAISSRSLNKYVPGRYKFYKEQELGDFCPAGYAPKVHDYLWRHHLVKNMTEPVIVCEGFKACLWCVQHGFASAVALLGCHITEKQVLALASLGRPVWLMLDNNEAGRIGQKKAAINIYRAGVDVYLVKYEADQPDDLLPLQLEEAFSNPNHFIRGRYG